MFNFGDTPPSLIAWEYIGFDVYLNKLEFFSTVFANKTMRKQYLLGISIVEK